MKCESIERNTVERKEKGITADSTPTRRITFKILLGLMTAILLCSFGIFAQEQKDNPDKALKSSGRVNPSTLAMEIDIPLGSYPGRGINVPISLSYSSKVWRMDTVEQLSTSLGGAACKTYSYPNFSEDAVSGWTSSLDVPYVEFTGWLEQFTVNGFPVIDRFCENAPPPQQTAPIRRITVHLPSGETHELRADAAFRTENHLNDRHGTYYAADGSNMVFYESPGLSLLVMPDGSSYNFNNADPQALSRRATNFTDRNGNYTSYNENTMTWTDTLGRQLESPLKSTTVGVKNYYLPGLNGGQITYKFHWKKIQDGLTNPADQLKYAGDTYGLGAYPYFGRRSASETLFQSNGDWSNRVQNSNELFNPVVLTKIELPTGQSYEFSYDVYGRIDKIKYPTGGEETFGYEVVEPLTPILQDWEDVSRQTNFGVFNRKLYKSAGSSPYQWNYSTTYVEPKGYKVSITNPEDILTERFLHRGDPGCVGCSTGNFGFTDALVGRAYETRVFDKPGGNGVRNLISKNLTHWEKTSYPVGNSSSDWHMRVTHEENYIYDPNGGNDYIWTTQKYEYEDISAFNKPMLTKKTLEYSYQSSAGDSPTPVPQPGENPPGNPLPVPTPQPPPSNLIRTTEMTHLIYDPAYQTSWSEYMNRNRVGLVTKTVVKNAADQIVAKSETKYDEPNYSLAFRGNPTTTRVWDNSTNDPNKYIDTKARFDANGNQFHSIDALGNIVVTEYDTAYNAFPIKVTRTAPDTTGTHGTNQGFITTATFDPSTGLPLTTTDVNLQTTTIEYDPVTLRPKKVTPPTGAGISETIYHDETNNYWVKNRTQIDANNWAESITYFDGLGRAYKAEQVDAQGNIFVEKEFDADGRVLRVTNPYRSGEAKKWTTNYYDDASRVVEVELPDGARVKTDYGISTVGKIGTTKQITDQAGKKRKGINDALGRMIRVIEDPDGQNLNTDYVFDTLGNLRKTIQGEQSRYFMHDSLGRLLYAKQPEQEANAAFSATDPVTNNSNWSVKYEYDDSGNITKTTDARGVYVAGTYDKFNRLILRDYSDNTPDVSFFYDGTGLGAVPAFSKGKTTKVSSTVSETRYTSFDNLGRLLTHEQRTTAGQLAGTEAAYSTAYSYNLSGALLTETYPSGRVVTNNYNTDGELDSVWGQKAGQQTSKLYINQITLNSSGGVEKARLGNGTWETAQYNERLQITQIGLGHSATDKSLLKIDYDYGTNTQNNGSLLKQTVNFTGLTNQITQDYTYDSLNRIKSATETVAGTTPPSWKQTFNYDRFGNRTFDAANTTTMIDSKSTNPAILTANNRFKEDQDNDSVNDYDYDENGNLKLDADNQRYIFNAENRIKEFFKSTNGTTNNPNATYEYDGEGKRVKKKSDGVETVFVYNAGGTLVAEYSTEISPEPQVSYLTSDHLGSPRIVTDGGGAVISRHDYMAFGDEVTTKLGNVGGRTSAQGYGKADDVRKQYTSYERDKESGLDYAQARYYNSNHGRFTSVDPLTASALIRNPQTFNRYSYVLNSPYKFTDPLGLLVAPPPSRSAPTNPLYCGADSASCEGKTFDPWADHWESPIDFRQGTVTNTQGDASAEGAQQESEEADPPPPPTKVETEVTASYSIEEGKLTLVSETMWYILVKDDWSAIKYKKTEETFSGGSSGIGECLNNTDCAKDEKKYESKGPIPIGDYFIDVKKASVKSIVGKAGWSLLRNIPYGGAGDWGSFRMQIRYEGKRTRGTAANGRFYLHGGDTPGSAGCIDMGGGNFGDKRTNSIISILQQDTNGTVPLTVSK